MKLTQYSTTAAATRLMMIVALVVTSYELMPDAHAQGMGDARQACQADYQQFCSGVQPGGGRIKMCLEKNALKLSSGCKAALHPNKASNGS